MTNYPPFKITPFILNKTGEIANLLGLLHGRKQSIIPIKLRKSNNIKTIQASFVN